MAVGRLTELATAETATPSASVSVVIPDDGSVAEGDLLILAAVMPSGSRTHVVSGVDGFTSLGSAVQPGHTSEVWWKIAEEDDLGATVTVAHTGGTGGIRQIAMLGAITGADPDTPIADSDGVAITVGATTKTTPVLTNVPEDCREISLVFDSRGAVTPNTSTWTPPTGVTLVMDEYMTGTTTLCSAAAGDTDELVSGSVGGREWTADQPAIGSAWTVVVAPAATGEVGLGAASTAVRAPGVAAAKATGVDSAAVHARGMPVAATKTTSVGAALEVCRALPVTAAKHAALGAAQAAQRATPLAVARSFALQPARTVARALPLTATKHAQVGTAATVDTAKAVTTPATARRPAETLTATTTPTATLTAAAATSTLTATTTP